MRKPDDKVLQLVLRPDEMVELKKYCQDHHMSMSAYIRFCIKAGYNRGFDFADRVIDAAESPSPSAVKDS